MATATAWSLDGPSPTVSLLDEEEGTPTAALLPAAQELIGALGRGGKEPEPEKKKKSKGPQSPMEKRRSAMGQRVNIMDLCSVVVILLLFGFTALIFLNFTFCFSELQPSDISFYDPTPDSSAPHRQCDRFGMWWWFVALTLLRLVLPIASLRFFSDAIITGSSGTLTCLGVWIIIFGLYDFIVTVFFLMVAYIQTKCEDVQFCRGFTGDPDVPNKCFLILAWSGIVFLIIEVIYCIHIKAFQQTLRKLKVEQKAAQTTKER